MVGPIMISPRPSSIIRATPLKSNHIRSYATNQSELDARLQQIGDAIRSNPELKQTIHQLKQICEEKGILREDKPPSMFKLSTLLLDKRVTEGLKKLYEQLEKSNISCSPEELQRLLKLYNQQNN